MSVIEKIMTTHVVTVAMDDTLKVIHEIFENVRFHHILVTEDNKLVGVISDRDLLKAVSPYANTPSELPRDAATLKKRAHQIMSRKPITIGIEGSAFDAVKLFIDKNISCLPVLDKNGDIAGILTWRDILKAISVAVEKTHKT